MTEDTDATPLEAGMLRRDPADPVRPGGAGAGDGVVTADVVKALDDGRTHHVGDDCPGGHQP